MSWPYYFKTFNSYYMKEVMYVIVYIFFIILFYEGVSLIARGWFRTTLPERCGFDKNPYYIDDGMFFPESFDMITKIGPSPLCKWTIFGHGRVPRWCKLSEELDLKYKELKIVKGVKNDKSN